MTRPVLSLLCTLGSVAMVLAGGCRSQQAPAIAAPEVGLTHYAGTPLAPADTPTTEPAAGNALAVAIRAYLLSAADLQVMRPLASSARIVTASGGEAPLLAVPSSLADARIGFAAEARQVQANAVAGAWGPAKDLGTWHGALAPGISAQMRIAPAPDPARAGAEDRTAGFQEVELVFSRPAQGDAPLRMALVRQSLYFPPAQEGASAAMRLPQPRREMEVTVLDYREGQDLDVAVLVPVSLAPGERQSLLLLARIAPGSEDPAHKTAVEAAERELKAGPAKTESASYEQVILGSALRAAEAGETRRAGLVYLATQGQAPIFLDAALVADAAVLERLVKELRAKAAGSEAAGEQALGWRLDRIAFDTMGALLIEGKLTPELRAVLSRHAGEVGHSAAAMEQLVGRTASRKDLENRLVAENFIFLEDISPAARVRAYDWLKAIGRAPPGYDPLGPADERRKALEAAIEQMAQSAQSGEGK